MQLLPCSLIFQSLELFPFVAIHHNIKQYTSKPTASLIDLGPHLTSMFDRWKCTLGIYNTIDKLLNVGKVVLIVLGEFGEAVMRCGLLFPAFAWDGSHMS